MNSGANGLSIGYWKRLEVLKIAGIGVAYFCAHQVSFLFPDAQKVLMAIWPAGGIGLAALLLMPRKTWPAIFVTLFVSGLIADLSFGRPLVASMGFMLANVAESALCAWCLTLLCGKNIRFTRAKEISALIAVAVLVNALTACIGAATAALTSLSPFKGFWVSWWVSDGLGILLVTPLIACWADFRNSLKDFGWGRAAELAAFFVLFISISNDTFQPLSALHHPHPFMLVAILAWPALRFSMRWVTIALALLAVVAITSNAVLIGPLLWGGTDYASRLLEVQAFIGVIATTGFLLTVAFTESKTSNKKNTQLSKILDLAPGIVILHDQNGRILYANECAATVHGYSREEFLQLNIHNLISAHDSSLMETRILKIPKGEITAFEASHVRKDGSLLSLFINVNTVDWEGRQVILSVCTDLSERKRAEESLRESEERLRSIINSTQAGYFFIDSDGIFRDVNPAWMNMYRYNDSSEVIGRNFIEVQKLDDVDSSKKFVAAIMAGDERYFTGEFSRKCKDGSIGYHSFSAHPVERNGKVVGIEGFIIDTTERYIVEAALRESEWQYRTLFTKMQEGFALHEIICDGSGKPVDYRFLKMNPAFEQLTGIKAQDAIGKTVLQLMPKTETTWIERYGIVALTGVPDSFENYSQELNRHYRVAAFCPHKDQFAVFIDDITDKQKMLENMQRTDKLDSLGVLAGGIAHDFNNLLGGMFGYIDLAAENLPPDSPATKYLTKAVNTFARAKDLTQQLLTFAKGGAPAKKTKSLKGLLKDSVGFALSGSNVSSKFSIADDLWLCEFDENQIGQVIDNIVINAHQAMTGGGMVAVSAVNEHIEAGSPSGLARGRYVKISIADQGMGIPASVLPRIFDPFFTTKEKGNGLGLSTVYSIVKKHGGAITVDSAPGKGTTFFVFLPASEKKPDDASSVPAASHKGLGRILLMDDEASILETVGGMVKAMGYTPDFAHDGAKALQKFTKAINDHNPFRVVIMDLTIPGAMGGRDAIGELRKLDGQVAVFVASGYSNDDVLADPKKFGFTDKIIKPFKKSELAELFNRHLPAPQVT